MRLWLNRHERALLRHKGLVDWLLTGERGISSDTIVWWLTQVRPVRRHHSGFPLDPSDFRRCERLLREVPSLRKRFWYMAELDEHWKILVEHWNVIVAMIDEEAPDALSTPGLQTGKAPRAYKFMHDLEERARERTRARVQA